MAKKAILLQQEYFYIFIFNWLCQLQRQFIVSFDTFCQGLLQSLCGFICRADHRRRAV
ncbi:hypothetical protein BRUCa_0737 [Brucella melitensis]